MEFHSMSGPKPETTPDSFMRSEAEAVGVEIGQRILSRFIVRRVLGVGAMGHVLHVRDEKTGTDSAIKCVPPHYATNDNHMRAIRVNYELVNRLNHPHIAALQALERDPGNGQYYLIMELVRGSDLSYWLADRRSRNTPIPIGIVLGIAEQIAMALDYAHSVPVGEASVEKPQRYGILHRDLKPANVMVESDREYRPGVPFVKLVDFGLAAQIQASLHSVSLNMRNKLAGTPVYMAPEQWEGRTLTRGVDQWALAIMIYEMVAGHRPFDAGSEPEVMAKAREANPARPRALSSAQWNALKIAFSADRRKRYRSCVEMVHALAEADDRTSDSIAATIVTMPDEFAGIPPLRDMNADASTGLDSYQTKAPSRHPFSATVKWCAAAALLAVCITGFFAAKWVLTSKNGTRKSGETDPLTYGYDVLAPFDPLKNKQSNADDLFPPSASDVAHRALTSAMEQITDPKIKGSPTRTKTLLEGPVLNPLNANHTGLAAARNLLTIATSDVAKSLDFERKLDTAKRALAEKRFDDALAGFDAARAAWPESGRFDEVFQYMKQARAGITVLRAIENHKKLDALLAKLSAEKADARNWADDVAALEAALEMDGNSNHPRFSDAEKLLRVGRAEVAFERVLKKVSDLMKAERFDDAQNVCTSALATLAPDDTKRSTLESMRETITKKQAAFVDSVADEAKKPN